MTHDIPLYGEESNINLNLSGDDQSIVSIRPLGVEVLKFVNGWIEERGDSECFLHGAFDESIGEGQSTW